VIFVIAVTAVAAVLRIYKLMEYPYGFHGDEGLTGFDAENILNNGWVGPYLASSLGYPAGYAYWTAFVVWMVGNDDWGVRFSSALLGTLTIPVAYMAFRVMFGYRVAVLASIFFAFSAWHMLYSRVAFLPVAWPFIEVAVMLALFMGVRSRRWYWYLAAGVLAGAGVYSYGSYPIFLAAVGIFLVWLGIYGYRLKGWRPYVQHMGVFALGFYLTALSMIQYIRSPGNNYFSRVRSLSLRETPQWKEASRAEQIDILWDSAWDWIEKMVWKGVPDGVDGAGWGVMLDPFTVALAAAGIVMLIAGWRRMANVFTLLVLFVVPWGAILTLDGSYRRALGMLPALVIAMALPLARVWEWSEEQQEWFRRIAGGVFVVVAVAAVCVTNTRYFFDTLTVSPPARFAYVQELAAASRYINETDPDLVYLLSGRWSYRYETRRFIAPDYPGEDRSSQFSPGRQVDLNADRSKDVLFIFIGDYAQYLQNVQAAYPEGIPYNGVHDGRLMFVAYFVPKHPDAVAVEAPAPR
jgi:4-amino-4-deoxy-L-arabinose transferase-like glycosyltransferase